MNRLFLRFKESAESKWYPVMVAFLAAADAFILVVPVEALFIPGILASPRKWLKRAVIVAGGSGLGAMAFAALTRLVGQDAVDYFMPGMMQSNSWIQAVHWMEDWGAWGLAFVAVSPLPQHPAVAVAGLSQLPLLLVLLGVFSGRLIKYGFVGWACTSSPWILRKVKIFKD